MKTIATSLLIFTILGILSCIQYQKPADLTTIYLVRHAERNGDIDTLNAEGLERSADLARVLSSIKFDALFASDRYRTQQTIGPIAEKLGLEMVIYDPGRLEDLAMTILHDHTGSTVMVSGHSNSTPALINALGYKPSLNALHHDTYDKLFIVLHNGVKPELIELEFGRNSP